ncbi:MAG: hypothetical protein GQ477_03090 [Nanohaloarchaea archaeon]|nr:hypothetical protein [Candidatus Nanohaloarchaea archaeon]
MDAVLCARCKGKGLCGNAHCPIMSSLEKMKKVTQNVKTDFFGSSPPSIFVGRIGYPDVSFGALAPAEEGNTAIYDSPSEWFLNNYSIDKIFGLRSSLINSSVKTNVYRSNSFLEKIQDIALASKPLDIEAKYDRPITPDVTIDAYSRVAPSGPRGFMNRLDICDNPHVPIKVDKVVSDTDLGAADAISILNSKDISENHITKLLSAGLLGDEKKRKLVPTRWSITATDDMISKNQIEIIRNFDEVGQFSVFSSAYLGNHFELIVMPGTWAFECIETTFPKSVWNPNGNDVVMYSDYEKYSGRKNYASNVAGGYYATRLPVTRYLKKKKMQASVLSIREVYEDYSVPLGVWLLRETVADAFSKEPKAFDSLNEAMVYVKSRLRLDFTKYLNESRLLKDYRSQRRLFDFRNIK